MEFTGSPEKKKSYVEELLDQLSGEEGDEIRKGKEAVAFGEAGDDVLPERNNQKPVVETPDNDEFAVWDMIENIERPNDDDGNDFILAGDFVKGLGYTPETLPDEHPLRSIDGDDFLTVGNLNDIQHFENTSAPALKAAKIYDMAVKGDQPAELAIAVERLSYDEICHLRKHLEQHGPVTGISDFELNLRLSEIDYDEQQRKGLAEEKAEIDRFFSPEEVKKRTGQFYEQQAQNLAGKYRQ